MALAIYPQFFLEQSKYARRNAGEQGVGRSEEGICREQARGILPQNLYTEYYATCNLNNLLKFIDLRTHEGAQWEIRKLANAMLDISTELWPIAIKSYRENKL